jgi:hypothetical protein
MDWIFEREDVRFGTAPDGEAMVAASNVAQYVRALAAIMERPDTDKRVAAEALRQEADHIERRALTVGHLERRQG